MSAGPAILAWSCRSRALAGEDVCGDAAVVAEHDGGALAALLDGLGHGLEAARAAERGAAILREKAERELQELVRTCHDGLRGTRGAALSAAQFDAARSTMTWLGVGNVEGVLLRAHDGRPERLTPLGGVVGYRMPALRMTSLPVERGDTLVLASDGLRSDFARGLSAEHTPEQLADGILARSAKGTDDACVLVARYLCEPRVCVPIRHPADVAGARLKVRELALRRGFGVVDAEAMATAVSEIARNALVHGGGGELCVAYAADGERRGLELSALDHGPGIADIALALSDGWSSTGSLGLGLSGARRFADEFAIDSTPGVGTTVTLRKWLP